MRLLIAWSVVLTTQAGLAEEAQLQQWFQWRGPLGTGVAPDANPPLEWSETKNVRWKVKIPGSGHATPIVWGNRVFVSTAIPIGKRLPPKYSGAPGAHDNIPVIQRHEFVVLAVDRTDGSIVWTTKVHAALPHAGGHYTGTLASASPITDGRHVYAFFGSYGLYCLDWNGKVVWEKQLGKMQSKHGHGEGSSTALSGDTLIVNWDHEGRSFVVALDKRTGDELWKVPRAEVTSWATPIIVEYDDKRQVIVAGTARIRGYDLETGKTIWECGGLSANVVATPVASDSRVFVASSYDTRNMLAIDLRNARGDLTGTDHVLWSRRERTPYVPSPLLYGDSLYFLRHYQGILSRVDAKTGDERVGPFRLGRIRDVYASPVGAADRVYITGLDGTTQVISHNEVPRILAVNRLDENISASAAIAGGEFFLRGQKSLYCFADN